jgi:hypothetical protein
VRLFFHLFNCKWTWNTSIKSESFICLFIYRNATPRIQIKESSYLNELNTNKKKTRWTNLLIRLGFSYTYLFVYICAHSFDSIMYLFNKCVYFVQTRCFYFCVIASMWLNESLCSAFCGPSPFSFFPPCLFVYRHLDIILIRIISINFFYALYFSISSLFYLIESYCSLEFFGQHALICNKPILMDSMLILVNNLVIINKVYNRKLWIETSSG